MASPLSVPALKLIKLWGALFENAPPNSEPKPETHRCIHFLKAVSFETCVSITLHEDSWLVSIATPFFEASTRIECSLCDKMKLKHKEPAKNLHSFSSANPHSKYMAFSTTANSNLIMACFSLFSFRWAPCGRLSR